MELVFPAKGLSLVNLADACACGGPDADIPNCQAQMHCFISALIDLDGRAS